MRAPGSLPVARLVWTMRIRAVTSSCRGRLHRQGVGVPASRAAFPLTASAFAIA
jgi:hypothetical protein